MVSRDKNGRCCGHFDAAERDKEQHEGGDDSSTEKHDDDELADGSWIVDRLKNKFKRFGTTSVLLGWLKK